MVNAKIIEILGIILVIALACSMIHASELVDSDSSADSQGGHVEQLSPAEQINLNSHFCSHNGSQSGLMQVYV